MWGKQDPEMGSRILASYSRIVSVSGGSPQTMLGILRRLPYHCSQLSIVRRCASDTLPIHLDAGTDRKRPWVEIMKRRYITLTNWSIDRKGLNCSWPMLHNVKFLIQLIMHAGNRYFLCYKSRNLSTNVQLFMPSSKSKDLIKLPLVEYRVTIPLCCSHYNSDAVSFLAHETHRRWVVVQRKITVFELAS